MEQEINLLVIQLSGCFAVIVSSVCLAVAYFKR
jgi:hypothetical protein